MFATSGPKKRKHLGERNTTQNQSSVEQSIFARKHQPTHPSVMITFNHRLALFLSTFSCLFALNFGQTFVNKNVNDGQAILPPNSVIVDVGLHFRRIESICSLRRTLRVHFVLQLNWTDSRLLQQDEARDESFIRSIWTPSIYFSNELRQQPSAESVANSLTFDAEGHVNLRRLVSANLICPMHFESYPLDVQKCPIIAASWDLPESRLKLQLTEVTAAEDAFEDVPHFNVKHAVQANCSRVSMPYGEFSCVRVEVVAKREFSPFLLKVYVPLTMSVLVSMTTFWSRIPSVRVMILMASLLLAAGISYSETQSAPSTNYVKFLNLFTGTSLMFIVAMLLELHTVMYLFGRSSNNDDNVPLNGSKRHTITTVPSNPMDKYCRALFPLVFLFFIAVYSIRGYTSHYQQ